jgi:hypothetical protein
MEIQLPQTIRITHSPSGRRLSKPIVLQLPPPRSAGEESLRSYVIDALSWKMPVLVRFTLQSEGALKVAKHLQRHATGSPATLYQYIYGIWRFCEWLGKTPDELIAEARAEDGSPDPKALTRHAQLIDDFIGECQAERLAPGTIANHVKGVKALYQVNGLTLTLPYRLPKTVKFKDRAPTPEELSRLLDISKPREKVVLSCLALGGFRVGTLCQLQYRHVRGDLERGIIPIHVHVEAEITKGKYGDYDTFLGAEAAEYLKLYLDQRRRGNPLKGIPPETITDESPLIRNIQTGEVRPLSPGRVDMIVHSLYARAGLIAETPRRRYELRAHSIRKFFRTQLAALGVPGDYVEYMMGHKVSVYHDVRMKGVEYLRNIYAASGLSIRPRTRADRLEMLKEIIRAWGEDPERILTREALAKPWRTYVSAQDREDDQVKSLAIALKETLRKELLSTGDTNREVETIGK